MTNEQFKQKLIDLNVKLNGVFCDYDIVINKKLEIISRMRKIKGKPNLKPGEIVIIKAIDNINIFKRISIDAINTTLALYDLQENEDKEKKITELDLQIKHQIELIKYNVIADLIIDITPIKNKQIYYSLGIKNAEQLINGIDTIPIY